METIEAVLEELGVSPTARGVYLSLLRDGEATARVLAKRTSVTRPSIYDQVRDLRNRGLVVEREVDGKTYFGAGDVTHVQHLLEERIERLEIGRDLFTKQLPMLLAQSRTVQPKIRFFEGAVGVREMLKDMLWYEKLTVSMCWPYTHMHTVLGEEYLHWFNKRRIRDEIAIRTLWNHDEKKMRDHLFKDADTLVQRRYAKKEQHFAMAYAIYDDKVAFISSAKESFGFLVQSREFANLMGIQFEAVWAGAGK